LTPFNIAAACSSVGGCGENGLASLPIRVSVVIASHDSCHYIGGPFLAGMILAMFGSMIAQSIFWIAPLVLGGLFRQLRE
jgi:hypothetical protein